MREGDYVSDVVVVGGGASGLYAAISAQGALKEGTITLLVPDELGAGGCSRKTHGINAAVNRNDSWQAHARDTYEGGGRIGDPRLIEILCKEVPARLAELESWGVRFAKTGDQYDVGTYGGSSAGRSVHWFDMAGMTIVHELTKRVILAGCVVCEGRWLLELMVRNGRCFGVVAFNRLTNRVERYYAKSVILATGGGACVYPIASISADKLGTGIVVGYRAGATVVDMEMVQFHPTGIVAPGHPGNGGLLEEELRAQGAVLRNAAGISYMQNYDSRGAIATRDVVARASYLEIVAGRGTPNRGVFLDISPIDKQLLLARLPEMAKRLRSMGIEPKAAERLEVSPTAHFLMGGLRIHEDCQTDIHGLFACGEDAGGVHGGNRLGGNGVAEALVFGHRSGVEAAGWSATTPFDPSSVDQPSPEVSYYAVDGDLVDKWEVELKRLMWASVGVVRWQSRVAEAWMALIDLRQALFGSMRKFSGDATVLDPTPWWRGRILMNRLDLALLITASAQCRRQSVGAHYLADASPEVTAPYNVLCVRADRVIPVAESQPCGLPGVDWLAGER